MMRRERRKVLLLLLVSESGLGRYTVKYRQSAPTHVNPPRILTSETFGLSACAKWGCYHLPLPCIHPLQLILLF